MGSDDKKEPRKVIDMTERMKSNGPIDRLKAMKVRLDLEQAKVAIPTSLLSIVIVVTLANSKLLQGPDTESRELASSGQNRGIASVPTGTSEHEDQLVKSLAAKALSDIAAVGKEPSALDRLTFETLEGKYAVHMDRAQKIESLQISPTRADQPVAFGGFIEKNRQWMPAFDKSIRVAQEKSEGGTHEVYQLVNKYSMPVAEVSVDLDKNGGMVGLTITAKK